MWQENVCVIKKIPINDPASVQSDPDVTAFIEKEPVDRLSLYINSQLYGLMTAWGMAIHVSRRTT